MSNLISYLFETNAFKICPENKPFWYTSGKIGPYFINAQFLYGSEQNANDLLTFIDSELENSTKYELPKNVFERTLKQYNENEIYKTTIDEFINFIEIYHLLFGKKRDIIRTVRRESASSDNSTPVETHTYSYIPRLFIFWYIS